MDDSVCPVCGAPGSSERYTVDRLGVHHWFRECPRCRHRWGVRHLDPACDNPYLQRERPSWRPDPPPPLRPR